MPRRTVSRPLLRTVSTPLPPPPSVDSAPSGPGTHGRIADGVGAQERSVRTVGCFTDGHGRAGPTTAVSAVASSPGSTGRLTGSTCAPAAASAVAAAATVPATRTAQAVRGLLDLAPWRAVRLAAGGLEEPGDCYISCSHQLRVSTSAAFASASSSAISSSASSMPRARTSPSM